jgi:hypothetical protein
MKAAISLQINRVANGIIITANVESKQLQLIAKDEADAREIVTKLVEEHLVPESTST